MGDASSNGACFNFDLQTVYRSYLLRPKSLIPRGCPTLPTLETIPFSKIPSFFALMVSNWIQFGALWVRDHLVKLFIKITVSRSGVLS